MRVTRMGSLIRQAREAPDRRDGAAPHLLRSSRRDDARKSRYLVVSRFLVVPRCISRFRALLGQRLLISPLIMGISQAQHHGRGSCVAHFPDP